MDAVWVPVDDLWNWFDVGAYIEAVVQAENERIRRAIIESGWFPHASGETPSIGLFQQSPSPWAV